MVELQSSSSSRMIQIKRKWEKNDTFLGLFNRKNPYVFYHTLTHPGFQLETETKIDSVIGVQRCESNYDSNGCL